MWGCLKSGFELVLTMGTFQTKEFVNWIIHSGFFSNWFISAIKEPDWRVLLIVDYFLFSQKIKALNQLIVSVTQSVFVFSVTLRNSIFRRELYYLCWSLFTCDPGNNAFRVVVGEIHRGQNEVCTFQNKQREGVVQQTILENSVWPEPSRCENEKENTHLPYFK